MKAGQGAASCTACDNLFRRVGLHIIDGGERAAEAMTDGALWVWGHVHGLGRVARSPFPRRAHESTLDAELNDFGVQLAMLGGHAADSDGQAEAARPGTARI